MKDAIDQNSILIKAPIEELQAVIRGNRLEGVKLDFSLVQSYGVFIVRDCFDPNYINSLFEEFKRLVKSGELKRSPAHPTEVRIQSHHSFSEIVKSDIFLDLARHFFGGEIALDFMRIIKKDEIDTKPVFLHQDIGYQVGNFEAYSFFIPLTNCDPDNGGLAFYPGTNNFGLLGDVGGIASILPDGYPILHPGVSAGDVIIMHSGTWHFSAPNSSGLSRVYLEINIRSSKDPGAKNLLGAKDQRKWILNIGVSDLFESSREQRLKILYGEIERLKVKLNKE
jgi:hypothetical protein